MPALRHAQHEVRLRPGRPDLTLGACNKAGAPSLPRHPGGAESRPDGTPAHGVLGARCPAKGTSMNADQTSAIDADETVEFTYEGRPVTRWGDMLNLTSMWRATGKHRHRNPSQWLRLPETRRFLEQLATELPPRPIPSDAGNMGKSHIASIDGLVTPVRGGPNGLAGTWGHWQVGLAYAKYLSPSFHIWCNGIVRTEIERFGGPAYVLSGLPCHPDKAMIEHIESLFARLHRRLDEADRRALDIMFLALSQKHLLLHGRQEFTDESKRIIREALMMDYAYEEGRCPNCRETPILSEGGVVVNGAEYDHFVHQSLNRPEFGWLICKQCHNDFSHGGYLLRGLKMNEFHLFQDKVQEVQHRQRQAGRASK